MKLRQVIGEQPGAARGRLRQRSAGLEMRAGAGEAARLAEYRVLVRRWNSVQTRDVTECPVMQQRVLLGIVVEVALPVEPRVEFRRGIAALAKTPAQIMLERVDPGRGDVRIGGEVVPGVEFGQGRDGAAQPTVEEVAQQRLARRGGVARAVPQQVEMRRGGCRPRPRQTGGNAATG